MICKEPGCGQRRLYNDYPTFCSTACAESAHQKTERPQAMKRVYISGPMTGMVLFNYPVFHEASRLFRELGYAVVSPAELSGGNYDKPRTDFLKLDAIMLATICDAIALLPGWENASGAKWELYTAQMFGLEILDACTGKPMKVALELNVRAK